MKLDYDEAAEQLVESYRLELADNPDFMVSEMIKALNLDPDADLAGNVAHNDEEDTIDIEDHIWNDVVEGLRDQFEHCNVDAAIDLNVPLALDEYILESEVRHDKRTGKFYEGDANLIPIDEV